MFEVFFLQYDIFWFKTDTEMKLSPSCFWCTTTLIFIVVFWLSLIDRWRWIPFESSLGTITTRCFLDTGNSLTISIILKTSWRLSASTIVIKHEVDTNISVSRSILPSFSNSLAFRLLKVDAPKSETCLIDQDDEFPNYLISYFGKFPHQKPEVIDTSLGERFVMFRQGLASPLQIHVPSQ